jgi:tRNA(adenine34) deaminase
MDYEFFMAKALDEAEHALHRGEFPVGCVTVYKGRVLATGARVRTRPDEVNELDHAEMVALRRVVDQHRPVRRDQVTVFTTLEPCLMCYGAMIVNGIRRIVYAYEDVMGGGTSLDLKGLPPFYDVEMIIVPHVLRRESLILFKKYFSDPQNTYLMGTLLAEYTLKQ